MYRKNNRYNISYPIFFQEVQYCIMKDGEYFILIGKNISRIRKEQGLTIKELGFRCDIEKTNLIPIEKGRINVTIGTLLKICKALDVELKDLL